MPEEIVGLFHIALGLEYIHSNKMIHRDMKPKNVLIYVKKEEARLKICDFEYTKELKDGTHYDSASGVKGTKDYIAAELLDKVGYQSSGGKQECTTASDVFATGITFFQYLFGGLHPFGSRCDIYLNILNDKPINMTQNEKKFKKEELFNLLTGMMKLNPEDRLSITDVVKKLEEILKEDYLKIHFPLMIGRL